MTQRTSDLIFATGTFLSGLGMGNGVEPIYYAGAFVMTFSMLCDHCGGVKKNDRP